MRTGIPLLLLFLPLSALADPYAGMVAVTYDNHNHPGNTRWVECLADPGYDPSVQCCHSYHWCDEVYDEARLNGIEALIQSHHTHDIRRPGPLATWKSLGLNYQHTFGRQEIYPTHPDGIPLAVSGGHTDDELLALWECADAKNVPGQFLAMFGGEYTAGGATRPGCLGTQGTAKCGGHKALLYETMPDNACGTGLDVGIQNRCANEGEAYDLVEQHNGVVIAAHPTGTIGETDWTPYDPATAPGGIRDDIVVGYEFVSSREDQACVNGVEACGLRQVLQLGYKVHPTWGGDNHHHTGATGAQCFSDLEFPGNRSRGSCWVSEFTRSGLLGAMKEHRCLWTTQGDPDVRWSLDGQAMGASFALTSNYLEFDLTIDALDGEPFAGWELVRGEVGSPTVAVAASGVCGPTLCNDTRTLPPMTGWYYLRVLDGGGELVTITSAVWIEGVAIPTASPWLLGVTGLLLALAVPAFAYARGSKR